MAGFYLIRDHRERLLNLPSGKKGGILKNYSPKRKKSEGLLIIMNNFIEK